MVTIAPSGSWNGTAGSGGAAMSQSETPHGSGWGERAIANWLNFPASFIEDGDLIGVEVSTNDPDGWIEKVQFQVEGGTVVDVLTETLHPDGTPGYWIEPRSLSGVNGDANIYARVVPVNGKERVISRRFVLNTSATNHITRSPRYLSATGSDSNNGQTPETPWLTVAKALFETPSGGVCHVGPGRFNWNFGAEWRSNVTRQIEFRGAGIGETTFFRPTFGDVIRHSTQFLHITHSTVETDRLQSMYGNNDNANVWTSFAHARIAHSVSAVGNISYGYTEGRYNSTPINQFFSDGGGQSWGAYDVDISCEFPTYFRLARNVRIVASCDVIQINAHSDVCYVNVDVTQYGNTETRWHLEPTLTVASVSYNSGTNQTTITWAGSPTLTNGVVGLECWMRVLVSANGVPVGPTLFNQNVDGTRDFEYNGYQAVGQNNTAKTTTVSGNLSALTAGDLCRVYYEDHGDAIQWAKASTTMGNRGGNIFRNFKAESHTFQMLLPQPGDPHGSGTLSSSGTAITFSSANYVSVGDFIAPLSGTHARVYRRVTAIAGGGTTGNVTTATVKDAWPSDISGLSFQILRAIDDTSLINCVFNKSGASFEHAQFSAAIWNWGLINCTIPGWTVTGASVALRNPSPPGPDQRNTPFGITSIDTIWRNLESDTTFPTDYIGVNSHYETGTQRDTVGTGGTGAIWSATDHFAPWEAGYYPTEALTKTVALVRAPFDINNNVRAVGDPIGAVAKLSGGSVATGDPVSLTVRNATLLDPDGSGYGIHGNGWVAELVIQGLATGGTFDASKITLTVQDPGFDATGSVTRTRTITGGKVLRRQYPNDATTLIEASGSDVKITFSLDDDVYAGSTITAVSVAAGAYTGANAGAPATITNSSTLAYPKPLFAWLNPQHERATGTSFAVEAVAYHRHAMLGRQVARVEFIAKDETTGTAATQVVSAPALSSFQTKGNIVEAWKASVPLTALAQGNVCQVNAKVYPWIGDASAVLDLDTDGITWPAARSQTKLRFLNDKSGGYGGGFAYVKAGATGGAVSATAATARAAPFPTIVTALTALAAWNNTNKAHNDHSGGTIRLMDDGAGGAVAHAITNLNGVAAGNCLTDVEADPLNTAVASAALATDQRTTSMLRIRCDMSVAANAYLEGRNSANYDVHVYDGGTLTFSGGGFAQFSYAQGLQYWRNVTISGLSSGGRSPFQIFTGARNQVALALGIVCTDSTVDVSTDAVVGALIGCDFRRHRIVETNLATHTTADPSDGIVIANNRLRDVRAASVIALAQNYTRGIAFVQNIIERANVDFSEALAFSGDGAVNEIANVVFQHNTIPGTDTTSRINIAYADVAGSVGKRKTIYRRFNIARDWNMKGDLFDAATQGTGRVGNWKPRFAVGAKGDVAFRATDGTTTPAATSWLGDYWEPSSAIGTAPGFVDNKAGAALVGGGDYHLTGTTNVAYNRVPTGLQALAFDLGGTARRNNGTGAAGAYESDAPVVTSGTLAATLGAVTLGATGRVAVKGALAVTLGAVAIVAAGATAIKGVVSITMAPVGISAVGTVSGLLPVTGSLLATIAPVALLAAGGTASAGTGTVIASAERTIVLPAVGTTATVVQGLPLGAPIWQVAMDPSDRAPYGIDFTALLATGEKIASIQQISVSAAAALIGISIDQSSGRAPIIDTAGKKVQIWFLCNPLEQQASIFSGAGIHAGMAVLVRTDSVPYKEFERTIILNVRQQ